MRFASHDDYFATQPAALRARLEQIQQEVERQVPGATRTISYQMPAFRNGRVFFYFAAFKAHIGVFPPLTPQLTQDADLIQATQAFRGPKGNLSFRHDQALPLALIGRVARALAAQYGPR